MITYAEAKINLETARAELEQAEQALKDARWKHHRAIDIANSAQYSEIQESKTASIKKAWHEAVVEAREKAGVKPEVNVYQYFTVRFDVPFRRHYEASVKLQLKDYSKRERSYTQRRVNCVDKGFSIPTLVKMLKEALPADAFIGGDA